MSPHPLHRNSIIAPLTGLLLLGLFIAFNEYAGWNDLRKKREAGNIPLRERLGDTTGFIAKRLAFHDFEAGNTADTSTHIAATGYNSEKSLRMNSFVNFSPGLWIRFSDLKPAPGSWLRVRAMVWYNGSHAGLKCNLVTTCNRNGINYKYQSVALDREPLAPDRWNVVSLDYRIPDPAAPRDVVQVYFWYYGGGWMLADNIVVTLFEKQHE